MAYQTFGAQIKSLTGIDISNSTNQGYLDSYLTNAARDVLSIVPSEHLAEYAIVATLNNSTVVFLLYLPSVNSVLRIFFTN